MYQHSPIEGTKAVYRATGITAKPRNKAPMVTILRPLSSCRRTYHIPTYNRT